MAAQVSRVLTTAVCFGQARSFDTGLDAIGRPGRHRKHCHHRHQCSYCCRQFRDHAFRRVHEDLWALQVGVLWSCVNRSIKEGRNSTPLCAPIATDAHRKGEGFSVAPCRSRVGLNTGCGDACHHHFHCDYRAAWREGRESGPRGGPGLAAWRESRGSGLGRGADYPVACRERRGSGLGGGADYPGAWRERRGSGLGGGLDSSWLRVDDRAEVGVSMSIVRRSGDDSGRTSNEGLGPIDGHGGDDMEYASGQVVVVTRERGKNGKLMDLLGAQGVECLELPLIEYVDGPDSPKLVKALQAEEWAWVILTSPEAASVFLQNWEKAGRPALRMAVVGSGTGQVLLDAAAIAATQGLNGEGELLTIGFQPSKAQGVYLAAELPLPDLSPSPSPSAAPPSVATDVGVSRKVLYPASVKASHELEEGLAKRGFAVTRLNTYSTETVRQLDRDRFARAVRSPVITFASPTAVRAWISHVADAQCEWDGVAACIGSTTAEAAMRAGVKRVVYPTSPGMNGWVDVIMQALQQNEVARI
ncbi:hypothetical protein CBR_g12178 [Chara braunii]|uniref:Uroporphyrinogen-III synthase n=1 Tax=Chara braunii TaxID=69332 RepID=A0A388KRB8_CHABU|nr:hypothetical protein CBR_g12178 [Chara braunii]|eukprot:GBG72605.1 hypothetical protein CBR_g12178 [Chara braunii]